MLFKSSLCCSLYFTISVHRLTKPHTDTPVFNSAKKVKNHWKNSQVTCTLQYTVYVTFQSSIWQLSLFPDPVGEQKLANTQHLNQHFIKWLKKPVAKLHIQQRGGNIVVQMKSCWCPFDQRRSKSPFFSFFAQFLVSTISLGKSVAF